MQTYHQTNVYAPFARTVHEERFSMRPDSALYKTMYSRNTPQSGGTQYQYLSPQDMRVSLLPSDILYHCFVETDLSYGILQEEKEMLRRMTQDARQQRALRHSQARALFVRK